MVLIGLVGSFELAARTLPRFSFSGPESKCCMSVASGEGSSGFVLPNAHMTSVGPVDLSAGMVKTNFGLFPDRSLRDCCSVAIRGGFGSTVGMTSAGALRCDRVRLPSEFGHTMTMGEFAICAPNPLCNRGVNLDIQLERVNDDTYMAIHPTDAAPMLCSVSRLTQIRTGWISCKILYAQVTVEPLTKAPKHMRSVHCTSPFIPINDEALVDVEFEDDGGVEALGEEDDVGVDFPSSSLLLGPPLSFP